MENNRYFWLVIVWILLQTFVISSLVRENKMSLQGLEQEISRIGLVLDNFSIPSEEEDEEDADELIWEVERKDIKSIKVNSEDSNYILYALDRKEMNEYCKEETNEWYLLNIKESKEMLLTGQGAFDAGDPDSDGMQKGFKWKDSSTVVAQDCTGTNGGYEFTFGVEDMEVIDRRSLPIEPRQLP